MKLTKADLYGIIVGIFVGALLISNVLATKTFGALGQALPAGVIVFPLVYIANDVLAEIYGYKLARRAIFIGFAMNIVAVIAYSTAIALPPSPFYMGQEAFETVLGSTGRVLIASLAAYLVGSLSNAKVMDRLKNGKSLFARCIASTAVGETLDSTTFILVAFLFTIPLPALFIMILIQVTVKTVYEIVAYPLTKLTIRKIKALKG